MADTRTTNVRKHPRKTKKGRTEVKRHERKIKHLDPNMRKAFETLARNKKREYGTGWDLDKQNENELIIQKTEDIHRGTTGDEGNRKGRASTSTPFGVDVTVHTHPADNNWTDRFERPSGTDISLLIRDAVTKGKDEAYIISALGKWTRYRVIDIDAFETPSWKKRFTGKFYSNTDKNIEKAYSDIYHVEYNATNMTSKEYSAWVRRGRPTEGKWKTPVYPTKYDRRVDIAEKRVKAYDNDYKYQVEHIDTKKLANNDEVYIRQHNTRIRSIREKRDNEQERLKELRELQREERRVISQRDSKLPQEDKPKKRLEDQKKAVRRTWNLWRNWVAKNYNVEVTKVKPNKDGSLTMTYIPEKPKNP